MVTASNIFLATSGILYYEETGGVAKAKGLGFVDFEIRPHLNSEWFPKVRLSYLEELASKTKNSFYAIDDDTALTVIDGDVSVVAEGEWKKFD